MLLPGCKTFTASNREGHIVSYLASLKAASILLILRLSSLDKDLFTKGLETLQTRVEQRFYVTTLSFAQDLGDVIGEGVATTPAPSSSSSTSSSSSSESRFEGMEASPAKNPNNFADIRERRKLGKRILKAVQPLLEAALKVESEIVNKSYEPMQKELEGIIDTSVDTSKAAAKQERDGEDTIMVDAVDSSEITVKSGFEGAGDADEDAEPEGEVDADGEDAMDTAEDGGDDRNGGNIEVNTSGLGIVNVKTEEPATSPRKSKRGKSSTTGLQTSETPPDSNGYGSLERPDQTGPPTPPQSNGSFGKEPSDPLTEGGVLWYLKSMQPRGTSILGEEWVAGRDAVRMLSEELTDMDDEELKGLRADVDGSVSSAGMVDGDFGGKGKAATKNRKRRTSGRRR